MSSLTSISSRACWQEPRRKGRRKEAIADWSVFLNTVGFDVEDLDLEEFPSGLSAADCIATDAWRFAERMGFVDPAAPTACGRFALGGRAPLSGSPRATNRLPSGSARLNFDILTCGC